MKARLNRFFKNGTQTLGIKTFENGKTFFILEPAWKNNQIEISCIPDGLYVVKPHVSPTKGQCFKIYSIGKDDVIGRDEILVHIGNYRKNTKGCQLPGLGISDINKDGQYDVTSSGDALRAIMSIAPDGYELEIVTTYK